MAVFKFYNIQLLPTNNNEVKEVGSNGYCKLFAALQSSLNETKEKKYPLSAIAAPMQRDMFFAPYSIDIKEYPGKKDKKNRIVHGYFLKFDNVNELFDIDSGKSEYKSKGNTSSKRYSLEFVFDPKNHILAINDIKGLPSRTPLIKALEDLFSGHAHRLFPKHGLTIDELTSADSLEELFSQPIKGFKSYKGKVTFSNSDLFDTAVQEELRKTEQEMKDTGVAAWESKYSSFDGSVMSDLPSSAKVQMALATQYGNAETVYMDENGKRQKYQMQDFPVRLPLEEEQPKGTLSRALSIKNLIVSAKQKTRAALSALTKNNEVLDNQS